MLTEQARAHIILFPPTVWQSGRQHTEVRTKFQGTLIHSQDMMHFQFVFMLIKVRQVEHFMLPAFRCLDMKEAKF